VNLLIKDKKIEIKVETLQSNGRKYSTEKMYQGFFNKGRNTRIYKAKMDMPNSVFELEKLLKLKDVKCVTVHTLNEEEGIQIVKEHFKKVIKEYREAAKGFLACNLMN